MSESIKAKNETVKRLGKRLWSAADLPHLTGRQVILSGLETEKVERGGRKSKLHCANPRKSTRPFKGRVARLASEYEGIKSTLWVWPDQKRVWRPLTAQSVVGGRIEELRGYQGGARVKRGSAPPDRRPRIIKNYQLAFGWAFFSFFFFF